jgi:hypothetical protein
MAKIIAPQKSGSVGTSTFQLTRQGLVERQRTIPLDPETPRQLTQRGRTAGVASQWRALTEAQRAGWRALGSQLPGQLSGYHAYLQVNVTRLAGGLLQLEAAPPLPSFGILVTTGLVADDTPRVKLLQVSATVAPERFLVEATPPLSAGLGCVKKLFRRVTSLPGHAGPGVDLDLTAAYLERFNAPQAGQRLWMRLVALTNGLKGTPVQLDVIVAPHGAPRAEPP